MQGAECRSKVQPAEERRCGGIATESLIASHGCGTAHRENFANELPAGRVHGHGLHPKLRRQLAAWHQGRQTSKCVERGECSVAWLWLHLLLCLRGHHVALLECLARIRHRRTSTLYSWTTATAGSCVLDLRHEVMVHTPLPDNGNRVRLGGRVQIDVETGALPAGPLSEASCRNDGEMWGRAKVPDR